MTYLEMEMKELGKSNNTHNISSLIHTPQVCHRRLAVGKSLHGGRVYTHTRARASSTGRRLKENFIKMMQ